MCDVTRTKEELKRQIKEFEQLKEHNNAWDTYLYGNPERILAIIHDTKALEEYLKEEEIPEGVYVTIDKDRGRYIALGRGKKEVQERTIQYLKEKKKRGNSVVWILVGSDNNVEV
jgi:hypothetical protein